MQKCLCSCEGSRQARFPIWKKVRRRCAPPSLRAAGVYEDLLGALYGLKRPGRLLGVSHFIGLGDLLPDDYELLAGDSRRGELTALDIALVSALEGGADGDDLTQA
jgi:hypothetical protein